MTSSVAPVAALATPPTREKSLFSRFVGVHAVTIAHLVVLGSLGVAALALLVIVTLVGLATAIVLVGFVLLALAVLYSVGLAWFERERVAGLLGEEVPPGRLRRSPRTDWLRGPHTLLMALFDGAHWRAIGSLLLGSVLGAMTIWLLGLAGYGVPLAFASLGQAETIGVPFLDIQAPVAWSPLVGILSVLIGTAGSIALSFAHRAVSRSLLVPNESRRLAKEAFEQRQQREGAVRAADLDRTRIERDLHDGVQPRLVAIGMQLGMAREKIETDPAAARALLDEAHASTKSAVTELRQLARGIHVAVLDDRGLDAAVSALAARSAVPVEIDARIEGRCSREAETAVYFAIAESITNAQKHARASRIRITIRTRTTPDAGGSLWARIEDDGIGGAERQSGGGIDGLAHRIAGAGGTLVLSSPAGGPTAIEVNVPCAS